MNVLLVIALMLYLISSFHAIFALVSAQLEKHADKWSRGLVALGFAAHSSAILIEWQALGHFPIVNFKEVLSFTAWAIAVYYLFLLPRRKKNVFPIFMLSCAFALTMFSLLLPEPQLTPALQSAISASTFTKIIFPIHVSLLVFSYAAFAVTVAGGVMYLLQERELKAKRFGTTFQWMPALNTCDEIGYRSLSLGFVLLTLGMVTGMLWANQHDGRFWHNDPKEVMALVTWIVYLMILHYRLTAGWRGRRVAWMAIGGFVAVLLTFIGARAMGGYHVFG